MSYIKYIIVVLSFLTLCSCEDFFETTLELELPEFESQVVVSGVFDSDRIERELQLSQTLGLNEDPFSEESLIKNANIVLTYPDGQAYTFEEVDPFGVYARFNYEVDCPMFTQEGIYTIKASVPDGREAMATALLPQLPIISSTKYEENAGSGQFDREYSSIDIIINDSLGEENFYKFSVRGIIESTTSSSSLIRLRSRDPSGSESRNNHSLIVSDQQFDGQEYKFRALFDKSEGDDMQSFLLEVSQISKDQYKFDKTLSSAQENNDNPFTSPVQLHTNIEGGLGIFALERKIEIDVEK